MIFHLPDGVKVEPGDVVTLDAETGWVGTVLGSAPAVSGLAVSNRAGRPSSVEDWEGARSSLMRVGVNVAAPSATYWSSICANKNRAKDLNVNEVAELWPDGTIAQNVEIPICQHGNPNGVDYVGFGMAEGPFLLGWGDKDPSKPVTCLLKAAANTHRAVEMEEYRNEGDEDGKGKVRVYWVEPRVHDDFVLDGAIDASTTSIKIAGDVSLMLPTSPDKLLRLTIGGEAILTGPYDHPTKTFSGCTRGFLGTTPASHASGSPCPADYSTRSGSLKFVVSAADGQPHYEDLRIYNPEDAAEFLPDPPAPVVLPPEDHLDANAIFDSHFDEGVGVLRCMDSTATFSLASELEHCSRPSDPHWNGRRFGGRYVLQGVRPYDPEVSPYVYSHIPLYNSEQYTATLGADIEDVGEEDPAYPGPVSTITITDGRTAPILYGSELWVDDERMRVVEIPKHSGTQYKVVRGVCGTTPATHAAGTITVGWRSPITNVLQYGRDPDDPYHDKSTQYWCEAIIDEDASMPLITGRTMVNDDTDPDGAPLARRSLTFPDGIPSWLVSDGQDITVEASEEDWDYIAPGLEFVVGTELIRIFTMDRTAGTITTWPRSQGAVSYPPGTTATTRASKYLVGEPGSPNRVWVSPFWYSTITLTTGPNTVLLQQDYLGDPGPQEGIPVPTGPTFEQEFEPGAVRNRVDWMPAPQLPYEFGPALLARKAPKGWYWVNLPYLASDAMAWDVAKITFDHLLPTQKLIVELSNEIWNPGFPAQNVPPKPLSRIQGTFGGSYAWCEQSALRVGQTGEIFRAYAASIGRPESDVIVMAAWQFGQTNGFLQACRRMGADVDANSYAPYMNPPIPGPEYRRFHEASNNPQAIDQLRHHHEFNRDYINACKEAVDAIDAHELATGKRLINTNYECGDGTVVPCGYPGKVDPNDAVDSTYRERDLRLDPQFRHYRRDTYLIAQRIWGVEVHAVFCLGYSPGGWSPFVWCLTTAQWKQAGRGDGTDGKVDNRLCLFQPGQEHSADLMTSPDTRNVEPSLLGWKEHQRDYFAGLAPADGPAAVFVGVDTVAKGSWAADRGSLGRRMWDQEGGDMGVLPPFLSSISDDGAGSAITATPDAEARYLLEPGGGGSRTAWTRSKSGSLTIDLTASDESAWYGLSLYAVDDEPNDLEAAVRTPDGATTLATGPTRDAASGVWWRFWVKGSCSVEITGDAPRYSAIHFDGAATSLAGNAVPQYAFGSFALGDLGSVGAGSPPPASPVEFVEMDTTSGGAWIGKYGQDGYYVIDETGAGLQAADMDWLDSPIAFWPGGCPTYDYVGLGNPQLEKPGGGVWSYVWYNGGFAPKLKYTVIPADIARRTAAIFCTDVSANGRRLKVQAVEPGTDNVLAEHEYEGVVTGQWFVFEFEGPVEFDVVDVAGNGPVTSGIFFGPAA